MDPPPFRFPPSTPNVPLFPLSPERVNTRNDRASTVFGYAHLPQSPSLPELSAFAEPNYHSRTGSDVQHIVARFDSLTVKDKDEDERKKFEADKRRFDEERKRSDARLKRAEMGREEAEGEVRRLKDEIGKLKESAEQGSQEKSEENGKIQEEVRKMRAERDEVREKERKDEKRLEIINETMKRAQKLNAEAEKQYSKEIRRNKKEALMCQSALVKCQEELKATRNSLRIAQHGWDLEKERVSRREQEAFTAQYQLVGVQEEVARMKERLKTVEAERDALKTSLKEEEVARIAAEGRIALPPAQEEEDEFASPRKRSAKSPGGDKENVEPSKEAVEVESLRQDFEFERQRRIRAEDESEFLKMECHFRCCSCRVAERRGLHCVQDKTQIHAVIRRQTPIRGSPSPVDSVLAEAESTGGEFVESKATHLLNLQQPITPPEALPADLEMIDSQMISFQISDVLERLPSPILNAGDVVDQQEGLQAQDGLRIDNLSLRRRSRAAFSHSAPTDLSVSIESAPQGVSEQSANAMQRHGPSTPHRTLAEEYATQSDLHDNAPHPNARTQDAPHHPTHAFREVITTIKIPMAPFSPTTPKLPISREEALAQIAQRRGRARSIADGNLTPRKQMVEGVMEQRRDCSAPTLGSSARSVSRGRIRQGR